MHSSPCCLWGWNGGSGEHGNPYRCFCPERLHNEDIGIFGGHLLTALCKLLRSTFGATHGNVIIAKVNKQLMLICKQTPWAGLRVPCGTSYVAAHSSVYGSEHRKVAQIMPFALVGALPSSHRALEDSIINVFTKFTVATQLMNCRNSSPGYTDFSLGAIDAAQAAFVTAAATVFPAPHQASGWNFKKMHASFSPHFRWTVISRGSPAFHNADYGEAAHRTLGVSYEAGSKRSGSFTTEIVQHSSRHLAVAAEAARVGVSDPAEANVRPYDTSARRAARTRNNTLDVTSLSISLNALTDLTAPAAGLAANLFPAAAALLKSCPSAAFLPDAVKRTAPPGFRQIVEIVKGGVLAAVLAHHEPGLVLRTFQPVSTLSGPNFVATDAFLEITFELQLGGIQPSAFDDAGFVTAFSTALAIALSVKPDNVAFQLSARQPPGGAATRLELLVDGIPAPRIEAARASVNALTPGLFAGCSSVTVVKAPPAAAAAWPIWYSELCLFFRLIDSKGVRTEWAFLRHLEGVMAPGTANPARPRVSGSTLLKYAVGEDHLKYVIVPLAALLRKVHVVPDFSSPSAQPRFFLNPFTTSEARDGDS